MNPTSSVVVILAIIYTSHGAITSKQDNANGCTCCQQQGPKGEPGPQMLTYTEKSCSPLIAGALRYNVRKDVVQYCNGEKWISLAVEYSPDSLDGNAVNNPASSCLALSKLKGYQAGVYWIKPSSNYPAFQTYCKEGGWTLLMKIDGAKQTFHYDSPLWTSESSFNENNFNFDQNEAKLASFWTLPFKEILVGMKTGHSVNWVSLPKTAKSLRQVLMQNTYHQTSIGRSTWKSLVPGSSLQPYCNKEGFNVQAPSGFAPRLRIGILSNEGNHCNSPDSFIGLGAKYTKTMTMCGKVNAANVCGNQASCSPDNGSKNIFSIGYVFAR